MARLIDVDALLSELQARFDRAERDAKFTGNRVINVSWNDAICAIKQAKTVEAIPVEWILNYVEHMTNIFGPMDILTMLRRYEDGFIPSVPEKGPIEWEKENETNVEY